MCDIADTVDGVAPDTKVAVILLTETPHRPAWPPSLAAKPGRHTTATDSNTVGTVRDGGCA